MPRVARKCYPGVTHHVISRFLDKQFRFIDDVDRATYLRYLSETACRTDWEALSFSLMSSHVHHGDIAGQKPIATLLHPVHTRFALYWHRRHGGLGPVFAARPASYPMTANKAARMIAYHHRNPVDAGVVEKPVDSRWTSHRYYMRLEPQPVWLNVELGLATCGFDDTEPGRRAFDDFVREVTFLENEFGHQGHPAPSRHPTTQRRATSATTWQDLVEAVSACIGVPTDEVIARRRTTTASRLVLLLAANELGLSQAEIGRHLGLTRAAVSAAFAKKDVRSATLRADVDNVVAALEMGKRGVR